MHFLHTLLQNMCDFENNHNKQTTTAAAAEAARMIDQPTDQTNKELHISIRVSTIQSNKNMHRFVLLSECYDRHDDRNIHKKQHFISEKLDM